MTRTGRRPGTSDSRAKILTAAREEFGQRGYDGASLRGIASAAGVDPALVYHYFAGKQALFVAALEFPANPADELPKVLAGDREGLGERLVRTVIGVWDIQPVSPVAALLRSAVAKPEYAAMLRQFVTQAVLKPVLEGVGSDRPQLRGNLVASQLIGLAMVRYVLQMPPLAEAEPDEVVRLVAPTIQRYLTGELEPDVPSEETESSSVQEMLEKGQKPDDTSGH